MVVHSDPPSYLLHSIPAWSADASLKIFEFSDIPSYAGTPRLELNVFQRLVHRPMEDSPQEYVPAKSILLKISIAGSRSAERQRDIVEPDISVGDVLV